MQKLPIGWHVLKSGKKWSKHGDRMLLRGQAACCGAAPTWPLSNHPQQHPHPPACQRGSQEHGTSTGPPPTSWRQRTLTSGTSQALARRRK
eukprot:363076-Chlamydomonas_euryale.AAC.2